MGFGVRAGAVQAAGFDGHKDSDLDVVVAEGLAGEAHFAEEVPALDTSSSAFVIFSGFPSRYCILQVVHFA